VNPAKLILALTSVALLWSASASAQERKPSSFVSTIVKTVARDPATYAPAVLKYETMRLDWESSQIFFQHGFVERNARYTVSGRANDVAISHAAGSRKIAMDSLMVFAQSVPASLAERATEQLLIRRYPQHQKVWLVAGQVARIAGASYLSYSSSMAHVRQWRRNERLARQMGYK
jgi:hypothetical protein